MINKVIFSIDNLKKLSTLSKGEIIIFTELLRVMETKGQFKHMVILNTILRKQIIAKLSIQPSTFRNAISILCKKNFLKRIDMSIYKINTDLMEFN